MPLFDCVLSVGSAEGVAAIHPVPDRQWAIKFECDGCREVSTRHIFVDPKESCDNEGGTRNAIFHCSFCKCVITADVVSMSERPLRLVDENGEEGDFDGIVVQLDVRRGVPVELMMDAQWNVESTGGAMFPEADLSSGDWCEYDEDAGVSLSLMEVTASFCKSKKK